MSTIGHDKVGKVTRDEHLKWCKQRALQYVDAGDLEGAFTSFASDVQKHPETESITRLIAELGFPLLASGLLDTPHAMRAHINGYN